MEVIGVEVMIIALCEVEVDEGSMVLVEDFEGAEG